MSISEICPFVDTVYSQKLDRLLAKMQANSSDKLQQLVYHLQCMPHIVETVDAEELFKWNDEQYVQFMSGGSSDMDDYKAALNAFNTQQSVIICNRCGVGSEVEWSIVQTRSADEASTVFCVCRGCSARWRM